MKLLLIIDKPYHNELKDYLISLKGINDVKINNDNYLEVNINYDNKIIDDKIILDNICSHPMAIWKMKEQKEKEHNHADRH